MFGDIKDILSDWKLLRNILLIVVIAAVVSYFISVELKSVFQISRPCVGIAGCQAGFSFPSSQTTVSFGVATAVSLLVRRNYATILLYVLAAFVGLSRILLDQHSIYDVLGGVVFGVSVGFLIYFLFKKIGLSRPNRG